MVRAEDSRMHEQRAGRAMSCRALPQAGVDRIEKSRYCRLGRDFSTLRGHARCGRHVVLGVVRVDRCRVTSVGPGVEQESPALHARDAGPVSIPARLSRMRHDAAPGDVTGRSARSISARWPRMHQPGYGLRACVDAVELLRVTTRRTMSCMRAKVATPKNTPPKVSDGQ